MKRAGFTLIELLVTLIILGIVATIAVQSYHVLIKNNDESKYSYYLELIKTGADLQLETKKDAMKDGDCLSIDYQTLVDRNQVKEDNIVCTGRLLLRRNGKRYDYDDSLLSCKTKSENKVLKEITDADTTGCRKVD